MSLAKLISVCCTNLKHKPPEIPIHFAELLNPQVASGLGTVWLVIQLITISLVNGRQLTLYIWQSH